MIDLSERIAQIVELEPASRFLEFDGAWRTWGQLAATIDAVAAEVPQPGTRVGVLLRNRPAHVGLLLGLLRAGACVVTINPERGRERVRADIGGLGLPVLAGEPDDIAHVGGDVLPAVVMTTTDLGAPLDVKGGPAKVVDNLRAGVAVEMLTSGTTGPPKRVPLTYETLARVLVGVKYYERDRTPELRIRSGVAVVHSPLVHLGGLFRVLQCVGDGRPFCFLERFRVDDWVDAVRRHRPATASLVPAALRMVLEADVDPADLSSIRSVVSGTAPLDPTDAETFRRKYGSPVLISYAATEFGGPVAGWNMEDHEQFWDTKRGSVGRAHPGSELRVVDPDSGDPLPPETEGLLEVKTSHLGDNPSWVRTTDLARIDDDGFLFILGRADQAIIRGGFKVLPEDVRAALERDPRVRGAAVVSRHDARLGEVPVAAVELARGAEAVTVDDLLARASTVLARYELPDAVVMVDALPRTPAGKPDLAAVRRLFEAPNVNIDVDDSQAAMMVATTVEFDPFSDVYFNDPTEVYRRLRDEAPVYFSERYGFYALSRFDDVVAAHRDWQGFSSAHGVELSSLSKDPELIRNLRSIIMMDPPEHDRLRALVSRVFTPRAVSALEPMVRDVITSFLQPLEERDHFDAVADFSALFPVEIICRMLGVPEGERQQIREWIDATLHREAGQMEPTREGAEAMAQSGAYYYGLAADKRTNPSDDMLSRLTQVTVDRGDGVETALDDQEIAGFVSLLGGAGAETVTKLIANAVVLFHRYPAQWKRVADDSALIPAAVEEILRLLPPSQYQGRFSVQDREFEGGAIPAGYPVLLLTGAATRDPRVFDHPDEFDIDRPPSVAIGLGHGIHACLGAALARMESRIAIEELAARWKALEVDEAGLRRVHMSSVAGYSNVPVRAVR